MLVKCPYSYVYNEKNMFIITYIYLNFFELSLFRGYILQCSEATQVPVLKGYS